MFTLLSYIVSAFVMLVLMTFNVYVIISVIFGYSLGYLLVGQRLEKDKKNDYIGQQEQI